MTYEQSDQPIIPDLLEHEAGQDWHEDGLNEDLLIALQDREELIAEIVEDGRNYKDAGDEDKEEFQALLAFISDLKELNGIDRPPAREHTPGAPE